MSPMPRIPSLSLIPSDIRRVTARCLEFGAVNLGQGLSDLVIPEVVLQGARDAMDSGHNAYSPPQGIAPLRKAVAERMRRINDIDADPESEVTITSGSAGAFSATVSALFQSGDQLVIFEPFYPYHLNQMVIADVEPVVVPLAPPTFQLDAETLRSAIGPLVRGIVVCTPSNPSGRMFSKDELEIIAAVAAEHNLILVADEVYGDFFYEDNQHVSIATLPDAQGRTVTIYGASKAFHITGWRIGYVTAPAAMTTQIRAVNDLLCVCAPTPLQHGVALGLGLPDEYYDGLRQSYQAKRDRLCEALDASGLPPIVPQGSYFVLCDIDRNQYVDARQAADDLICRVGVGAVPATSFYRSATGDQQLRFCFAKTDDLLTEASRRLAAGR
jgi:aminotransferase